jgi:hypothetical protein
VRSIVFLPGEVEEGGPVKSIWRGEVSEGDRHRRRQHRRCVVFDRAGGRDWGDGSMLFLAADAPAPAGYTFVGRFDMQPVASNRGRGTQMQVDVYRRN